MFYRPCPDITPLPDAELDTCEMVEAAIELEQGEADLRMLARLAELAMEMAEATVSDAKARIAAAGTDGATPADASATAFSKVAQAVRRTLALKARFAADLKTRRAGLTLDRAAYRHIDDESHRKAKVEAVQMGFLEALSEEHSCLEGEAPQRLINDMRELLFDTEAFSDFLDRPVGETVAKLCAVLGLDPALCVPDGEGWKIRREPHGVEIAKETNPLPPSFGKEGSKIPTPPRPGPSLSS